MLGHIHCTEAATGRGVGGASRKPAPIRYPSPPSECPEYHIRQQEPDIQMGGTSACGEVDRADRIIGSFRGQCPWERPASSMGRWMAVSGQGNGQGPRVIIFQSSVLTKALISI
jgi:hypothetical protein